MASIFGTLGRKKQKKRSEGEIKAVFVSTPNLHKIHKKSDAHEPNGGLEYDNNQTWHSAEKPLKSSRSSSVSSSIEGSHRGKWLSPNKVFSKDSLRNITSVSSLVNTLRKSSRSSSYRSALVC